VSTSRASSRTSASQASSAQPPARVAPTVTRQAPVVTSGGS
jgi:hypothetical protein